MGVQQLLETPLLALPDRANPDLPKLQVPCPARPLRRPSFIARTNPIVQIYRQPSGRPRRLHRGQFTVHQGPAHARPVADRGVYVGDRGNALSDKVDRLAPQRGLQPVGDVSCDLAADVDRSLADSCVEGKRAFDGGRCGVVAGDDFDQWHEVRRVERMADYAAPRMTAIRLQSAHQQAGRTRGMITSEDSAASSRASNARFTSSRSGAFSWTKSAPA